MSEKRDLLQGTLDMLILKVLSRGPLHGYAAARRIEETADDVLKVEEGSLYPALQRMQRKGWIESEWGLTETRRRAKYYRLTDEGEERLEREMASWNRLSSAVARVLTS